MRYDNGKKSRDFNVDIKLYKGRSKGLDILRRFCFTKTLNGFYVFFRNVFTLLFCRDTLLSGKPARFRGWLIDVRWYRFVYGRTKPRLTHNVRVANVYPTVIFSFIIRHTPPNFFYRSTQVCGSIHYCIFVISFPLSGTTIFIRTYKHLAQILLSVTWRAYTDCKQCVHFEITFCIDLSN